jgi:uncharacterized delta-60 repeat protein
MQPTLRKLLESLHYSLWILAALFAGAHSAHGQTHPGVLDASFGQGGKVVTNLVSRPDFDYATIVLKDQAGKLILGGLCSQDAIFDVCITRFDANGSRDVGFGNAGVVVLPRAGNSGKAFAFTSGNAIVIAGRCADGNDSCLYKLTNTGELDASFGTNGSVRGILGPLGRVFAMREQGGKIVIAGTCGFYPYLDCISRFLADGSRDLSFNGGNVVERPLVYSRPTDVQGIGAIAIDGTGIVTAGACYVRANITDYCLGRYLDDGSIDSSFGTQGVMTARVSAGNHFVSAIEVRDGKITIAGSCNSSSDSTAIPYSFCLARLNAAGALDSGFGVNGVVLTSFPNQNSFVKVLDIDAGALTVGGNCYVNADGRICLARYSSAGVLDPSYANGVVASPPAGYPSAAVVTGFSDASGLYVAGACGTDAAAAMCVARFSSAGQLDTTFGNAGYLTADLARSGISEAANAVVVTYDQKYVAGGTCARVDRSSNACLLRYNRDGALDLTFGSGGSVTSQIGLGSSSIASLVATGTKIAALGRCVRTAGGPSETCVFQFNENGTLDSSFGLNGIAPLPVPMSTGVPDYNLAVDGPPPTAIAVQNGKLVIAGKCIPGKGVLCLVRLNADGSPDSSLGGAGFVTIPVHGLMNVGSVLVTANRILVGASCAEAFWYQLDYCVAGINENGTLDTTFGAAGVAAYRTGSGGYQDPPSMAFDGVRIVVASLCGGGSSGVCWSVLDQNGAPQYAPGKNFWGTVHLAEPYSLDIRVIINQGRMVIAGTCQSSPYTICASGFGLDGVLDASFGTAGHLVIPFPNRSAALRAVAIDAGSLVLAGECSNAVQSDVCVARVALAPGVPGAPLIVAAGARDAGALVSFSAPLLDGGSAVTLYSAACDPGNHSATGAASPILVSGLVNGTSYTCRVSATNSAGEGQVSDSLNVTPSIGAVIALLGAASRKTHGAAGNRDLIVNHAAPIDGQITVEPRARGAGHMLLFRFDAPVAFPGTAYLIDRFGKSLGTAPVVASGSESVVTIMDVPDNTRVTVSLTGVNGGTTDFFISLGFLMGDVNNSRKVNSGDITTVKARSGQVTDAGNFRFDVNLSGTIDSGDISSVKSRSGLVLP